MISLIVLLLYLVNMVKHINWWDINDDNIPLWEEIEEVNHLTISFSKRVTISISNKEQLVKFIANWFKEAQEFWSFTFDIWVESYVTMDFDEYCDDDKVSSYIDIWDKLYIRQERTLNEIIKLIITNPLFDYLN